jgi:hypothetical protein
MIEIVTPERFVKTGTDPEWQTNETADAVLELSWPGDRIKVRGRIGPQQPATDGASSIISPRTPSSVRVAREGIACPVCARAAQTENVPRRVGSALQ